MTVALPEPIELYFTSENARDVAATDRCFAANATVRDEGKTMTWRIGDGRAIIFTKLKE